jgi:DNA-binding NarL/FixJ family response regulator
MAGGAIVSLFWMKHAGTSIRMVLADDHPLVRAGIRAELEKLAGVEVVGEASNGREALDLVRAHKPEVVFIDISMPGLNGLEALARITGEFPGVRVIILSMHENEEYIWRALKAGASGYLLKRAATAELGAALENVMQGKFFLCKDLAIRFRGKFPPGRMTEIKTPVEKLTGRQREILQLIAEGRNTKEIAEILKLSPKTVEYHRMKMMDALNIHDIPGLVRLALKSGVAALEG